jgi:hypothetical protein
MVTKMQYIIEIYLFNKVNKIRMDGSKWRIMNLNNKKTTT